MMRLHFRGRCSLKLKSLKMQGQHSGSPKCDVCLPGRTAVHRDMIHCVMLTGDRRGIHQLLLRYQCLHRQWRVLRLDDASILQTVTVTCIVVSQQHTSMYLIQGAALPECVMTSAKALSEWKLLSLKLSDQWLALHCTSKCLISCFYHLPREKPSFEFGYQNLAQQKRVHHLSTCTAPFCFVAIRAWPSQSPVYCHVTPCQVRCF